MRITEIDLQCEDIMWFGIDINGNIFECTSAGRGNVPEYVCVSREETDLLVDYFTNEIQVTTEPICLIQEDNSQLFEEISDLASKGIYCYDVSDENDELYLCIAKPKKAINISSLPQSIQETLSTHVFNNRIPDSNTIHVEHAY